MRRFQRAQLLPALLRRLGLWDLRKWRNKALVLVKESRDERLVTLTKERFMSSFLPKLAFVVMIGIHDN